MSFDAKTLYELLPAIYRIRDAEQVGHLTPTELAELWQLRRLSSPTPAQKARLSDLEQREKASHGPLESLLAIFAEQIAIVEENLEQLYDDLFI